jgi:hypothetical protein
MRFLYAPIIALLFLLVGITSCRDYGDPIPTYGETDQTPLVMAHGLLASGDTYASFLQLFSSNGLPDDRIFAFDWNTLGGGDATGLLDAFIEDVLARTGASQVILMGHSAGGGLGYSYLSNPSRAAKVKRYIHIGSSPQSSPAGPAGNRVPTLNIYSVDDRIARGGNIPGATNVKLTGADHYEVATSPESFKAAYSFINDGRQPRFTAIQPSTDINVAGKAASFGDNIPSAGETVQVYVLDPSTGFRSFPDPVASFTTDANGSWGPFNASPDTYYEFTVSGTRMVHYYREPFKRSNQFVYLRTLPPPGSLTGTLLAALPNNDNQSVQIVFLSSQACVAGRDELEVDGFNLAINRYTSPDKTAIAIFLYDNGDNNTSGNTQGLFSSFPFLNAIDYFIPTVSPQSVTYTFNGRTLKARNWKSQSEGVIVVQFD